MLSQHLASRDVNALWFAINKPKLSKLRCKIRRLKVHLFVMGYTVNHREQTLKLLHCLLWRHWRRRVCSAKVPHKNAFFNQFPTMAHATASLLCPATTQYARCNAVHHHRV
ncbi:hypothetical protein P8452_42305 [Trifolium repens]|nr:hypothetical protein P8452_42305 [Trifolium repens]